MIAVYKPRKPHPGPDAAVSCLFLCCALSLTNALLSSALCVSLWLSLSLCLSLSLSLSLSCFIWLVKARFLQVDQVTANSAQAPSKPKKPAAA